MKRIISVTIIILFIPASLCSAPANDTWLIMLYQDADDYQLEEDIFIDMNEAEKVGSTKKVTIVTQFDRYKDGFDGDGDWSGTRRIKLDKDSDVLKIKSKGTDIGEQNMADGKTLVDFAVWAIKKYPAEKHVLILSDHGMGWPGGWTDPDPDPGDMLWMYEISDALGEIVKKTGIGKFEIVGFDACLMGHLEVFSTIAPHAKYSVASQELEPGMGWAYSGFLSGLVKKPRMDGAELASLIVKTYIDQDASITDPVLRSRLGGISEKEAKEWFGGDVTLSAVDLSRLQIVEQSLDKLVRVLPAERQEIIAKARSYSQSYANVFDDSLPASYIDLGHFAKLLKEESKNKKIDAACNTLLKSINSAVIAEKHGPKKPGSMGISIYFPNSELYKADWGGAASYAYGVPGFVQTSRWDDFLLFHYTGKDSVGEEVALPGETDVIEAPGKGNITISEIKLSSKRIIPGDFVDMNTVIEGDNIAFIFLFVGYYNEKNGAILIADKDYIEADKTKVIEGVYYPDWSTREKIKMEFEWEPILFSLTDDKTEIFSLLEPAAYGKDADQAVYYVDGIYTSADGKDRRSAMMYMDANGKVIIIYGFAGEESGGAPHEIKPKRGDKFTVLESWYMPSDDGSIKLTQFEGGTVTFGKMGVEWYDYDAPPGEYILGFIVEDFDGNVTEQYTNLTIID